MSRTKHPHFNVPLSVSSSSNRLDKEAIAMTNNNTASSLPSLPISVPSAVPSSSINSTSSVSQSEETRQGFGWMRGIDDVHEKPSFDTPYLALFLITVHEAFNETIVWAFLPFMIDELEIANTRTDLAAYLGVLVGAYFGAQLASRYLLWNWLPATIGKRRALLLGLIGSTCAIVAFGLSTSYWMALICRIASGILNGNLEIAKSYATDISDKGGAADSSLLTYGWGIGVIIAPLLSGILSSPASNYPDSFGHIGVLKTFPFLLPCLMNAALGAIAFVLSAVYLPDTAELELEWRQRRAALARADEELESGFFHENKVEKSLSNHDMTVGAKPRDESGSDDAEDSRTEQVYLSRNHSAKDWLADDSHSRHPHHNTHVGHHHHMGMGMGHDMRHTKTNGLSYWHPETVEEEEAEEESVSTSDLIAASKPQLGILATLWSEDVLTSVLLCAATCFLFTAMDETFALFCSLPLDQGGLGFNEPRIGILCCVFGVSVLLAELFICRPAANCFGTLRLFRISIFLSVFLFMLFPVLASMASSTHKLAVDAAARAAAAAAAATPNGNSNNNNNPIATQPSPNGQSSLPSSSRVLSSYDASSLSLPHAVPLSSDMQPIDIPHVTDMTSTPSSDASSLPPLPPLLSASSKGRSHPGSSTPVQHAYRRLWTALACVMIARGILMASLYTSVIALVNNSAPIGGAKTANAIGQFVMCLARVLGPIVAGTSFSWNAAPVAGLSDVSNQWRVYGMMAVCAIVTFLLSLGLPRDLNHSRTSHLQINNSNGDTNTDDDHDTSLSSHTHGYGYGYGSTYSSTPAGSRRSVVDIPSLSTQSHHRTLSTTSRDRSSSSTSLSQLAMAAAAASSGSGGSGSGTSHVHTTKYSYASRKSRHPSFTSQQLRRPKTIVMGGRTSYN